MTTIALQPSKKTVGGWLIVLILWLAFWIPTGVRSDVATVEKYFAPMVDQYPALSTLSSLCTLLLWAAAIVSVYCAYVLAFKKVGALVVAKRGLVSVTVLQLSLNGIGILLTRPALQDFPFGVIIKSVVWLLIWYSYLVRSKRVKETYLV